MRRVAQILVALTLGACGSKSELVAVEALPGAELRVVVARTSRTSDIQVLLADEPYRFEQEALSEVFGRDDVLRVWVFGFAVAAVNTTFPSIAAVDPPILRGRLVPKLGIPNSGVYGPPTPTTVLTATIDKDTDADVTYQTIGWDEVRLLPEAAFGFELAGDVACPPVDARIRVWVRGVPERTCVFVRNAACEWTRNDGDNCPNATAVFGASFTDGIVIRQRPDGALEVGDETCEPVAARDGGSSRGESRAWRCGTRTVAAQEPGLIGAGRFEVGRTVTVTNTDVEGAASYGVGRPGFYFGSVDGGGTNLRRVAIKEGRADLQAIEAPVIDRPTGGDRPAESTDGITIDLTNGDFATIVGESSAQCFRTLDGSRQLRAAPLRQKLSAATIELVRPGLDGALVQTTAWQIVGDPGNDFVASPTSDAIRLPLALGALERLTVRRRVDPIVLIAHGSDASYRMEQVTRFQNDLNYFGCPLPIEHPADLVGDIVAGSTGLYGLVANGVVTLDPNGAELRRFTAGGAQFDATHRITTARAGTAPESIIVWRDDGTVHFFDSGSGAHTQKVYGGTILAFAEGPVVLFRVDGRDFEIVAATITGAETTYVLPPFDETARGPVAINPDAVLEDAGRTLIGFSTATEAGVLDLVTGQSVSIAGDDPEARMVFTDDSAQEVWVAIRTAPATLTLVEIGR